MGWLKWSKCQPCRVTPPPTVLLFYPLNLFSLLFFCLCCADQLLGYLVGCVMHSPSLLPLIHLHTPSEIIQMHFDVHTLWYFSIVHLGHEWSIKRCSWKRINEQLWRAKRGKVNNADRTAILSPFPLWIVTNSIACLVSFCIVEQG